MCLGWVLKVLRPMESRGCIEGTIDVPFIYVYFHHIHVYVFWRISIYFLEIRIYSIRWDFL